MGEIRTDWAFVGFDARRLEVGYFAYYAIPNFLERR